MAVEVTASGYNERLLLPAKLTAFCFHISLQAFSKWLVSPVEKRGRESLYYLPEVIAYRLARQEKDQLDLTQERARLAKAQANRAELEVAQLEGELMPASAMLSAWENNVVTCRARLLAIPTKLAAQLGGLEPAEREAAIRDAIYETLNELAYSGVDAPGGADSGADGADGEQAVPAPAPVDDQPMGRSEPRAKSGGKRRAGSVVN